MNYRVLTPEQIAEARRLRKLDSEHYTKKYFARYYEVGETTVWENIFHPEVKRDRREYLRNYFRTTKKIRPVCIRCARCEICMTKEFENEGRTIPLNYQIGDKCIECYLRDYGLTFIDLINQ